MPYRPNLQGSGKTLYPKEDEYQFIPLSYSSNN